MLRIEGSRDRIGGICEIAVTHPHLPGWSFTGTWEECYEAAQKELRNGL